MITIKELRAIEKIINTIGTRTHFYASDCGLNDEDLKSLYNNGIIRQSGYYEELTANITEGNYSGGVTIYEWEFTADPRDILVAEITKLQHLMFAIEDTLYAIDVKLTGGIV